MTYVILICILLIQQKNLNFLFTFHHERTSCARELTLIKPNKSRRLRTIGSSRARANLWAIMSYKV